MKPRTIQRYQILAALLFLLIVGGLAVYRALNPGAYDNQARVDLLYHPIARILGALAPAVILTPFVYWMFGWIIRRHLARYKVCEHCAETIKSDAKICRYCGREVAPPLPPANTVAAQAATASPKQPMMILEQPKPLLSRLSNLLGNTPIDVFLIIIVIVIIVVLVLVGL
jgi:hypothetical protein